MPHDGPNTMPDITSLVESLTEREREVLTLLAEGMTIPEIAKQLFRSQKTIQTHRLSIGRKLGARNRVELTRIALQAGVSNLGSSVGSGLGSEGPHGQPTSMDRLMQSNETGIYRVNRQGRLVSVNDRWCQITGMRRELVIEQGRFAVYALDARRVADTWQRAVDALSPFVCVHRINGSSGSAVWVVNHALPVLDGQGTLAGFIGTLTPLSDTTPTGVEVALVTTNEITPSVAVADLEGRMTFASDSLARLLGYDDARALIGRIGPTFCVDPAEGQRVLETVREKGLWHGRIALRRRDGSVWMADIEVQLVSDDQNRPVSLAGRLRAPESGDRATGPA